MRIYLAGPMTGIARKNYPAFHAAAARLRAAGFEVVNPAELHEEGIDRPWAWFLRKDIPHLLTCDAVFVLDGWAGSDGAKLEVYIAIALGMPIYTRATFPWPEGEESLA
jgi:nucleoside 2-deoxyribosyltransferase